MHLEDYQDEVYRTMSRSGDKKANLSNYSMGLAGEAGEVLEQLKKHLYHGHELDEKELKKELGDVLWYLTAIAEELNIEMSDAARGNVRKLQARYPEGFDAELSQKRDTEKE